MSAIEPSRVSVVLPVYNQGDHIAGVAEAHLAMLDRLWPEHELLLVTNGCRDDSVAVCTELAERHPTVRTFDLPVGGWGRAVRAGLRRAEGDVLCYTNSARTTPEMLALMLSYARAYPHVVVKANRRLRERLRRRLGSLLYNLEARALFDLAVWDINGTPKVFPRSFDQLGELRREDDLFDLEFVVTCQRAGYPIVEIPVLSTTRHGGASTTDLRAAVRMYAGAIRLRLQ
ncbi:MAG: glycosyltransferase [Actinomycetota bacterium]|nr:glycosyltransferase [Actinomycetota bacterium]